MRSTLSQSLLVLTTLVALGSSAASQASIMGMLVTGESASEQVRSELVDGDTEEAEIAIKVPAQLNTGKELYLVDRVPGRFDVTELKQFIDSGGKPQSSSLKITDNKVELLVFVEQPNCAVPVPGLARPCMVTAKLSRTIKSSAGELRYRVYSVKLADALGEHLDAFRSGALTIALQTQCHEEGKFDQHRCETLISNGN